jgi:hypothetical protein
MITGGRSSFQSQSREDPPALHATSNAAARRSCEALEMTEV